MFDGVEMIFSNKENCFSLNMINGYLNAARNVIKLWHSHGVMLTFVKTTQAFVVICSNLIKGTL